MPYLILSPTFLITPLSYQKLDDIIFKDKYQKRLSGCCPAQPTPAFSSCPQLRLSPTLLSSYDPYDNMIFCLWPMPRITAIPPPSRLYASSSPLPPTLWEVPFGRSPYDSLWEVPLRLSLGGPLTTLFGRSSLGGGRSSSIQSSSLSSPFVFGLGDVPRRTRLPLKISAYSCLPDLP